MLTYPLYLGTKAGGDRKALIYKSINFVVFALNLPAACLPVGRVGRAGRQYSIIGYAELATLSSPAAAGSVRKLGSISPNKVKC